MHLRAEEVFQLAEEKGVLYRRYMTRYMPTAENSEKVLIPVLLVQQHLSVQIWVISLLKRAS